MALARNFSAPLAQEIPLRGPGQPVQRVGLVVMARFLDGASVVQRVKDSGAWETSTTACQWCCDENRNALIGTQRLAVFVSGSGEGATGSLTTACR